MMSFREYVALRETKILTPDQKKELLSYIQIYRIGQDKPKMAELRHLAIQLGLVTNGEPDIDGLQQYVNSGYLPTPLSHQPNIDAAGMMQKPLSHKQHKQLTQAERDAIEQNWRPD